jgi:hypothetical protein
VQSSVFEMVEMDKIVSGKRGWVTRGLIEYPWWGDRTKLYCDYFDKPEHYMHSTFDAKSIIKHLS